MDTKTIFFTLGVIILLGIGITLTGGSPKPQTGSTSQLQNGTQVVTITAKGGYRPAVTTAKAGIPTTLNMVTNNTMDCGIAFTIPQLGYKKELPITGTTTVEIPPQKAGDTIRGICSMGMYSFTIKYE